MSSPNLTRKPRDCSPAIERMVLDMEVLTLMFNRAQCGPSPVLPLYTEIVDISKLIRNRVSSSIFR